jgi:hypothetical protein
MVMKTPEELVIIYKVNQERLKAQRAEMRKKARKANAIIEPKLSCRKLFTKER